LLNYEDVYKWYIEEAIDRMILENVMYAELRPMLLDKSIPTNDGKGEIDNCAQMELIIKGVENKKKDLEKRGELHKFPFGLKIIYCTPRSIPKKKMKTEMMDCIELKLRYPDLICGTRLPLPI
jgi:adenosine deaminase CECR1